MKSSKLLKRIHTITIFSLLLVVVILSLTHKVSAQITTEKLIQEMVDLKNLAEYPSPYYNTVQYSSYDRSSTFPDAPGWFENSDGFGDEPIPGFEKVLKQPDSNGIGEYLICDIKGPGAIVRLWTAAINGTIRLYLDEKKEPVYDDDAYAFFTDTYNAFSKKDGTDFGGSYTQNMAGYYPVPFSKGCKIIWRGNIKDIHFYHVNIRLYEKGTKIKTFEKEDISKYAQAIKRTKEILADPDLNYDSGSGDQKPFAARIEPNEEKEILSIEGSKGISYFEMQIFDSDLVKALRQSVLRISFDGASDPQVQSPVGDFFGTSPGINPYQSLPFTVTDDNKLICRYFMPFSKSASFKIENLGDKAVSLAGIVVVEDYNWKQSSSMYFRAKWKIEHDMKTTYEDPGDIAYLLTSGKGVFVGVAAHLMNPSDVPSNYGNWWGEGDEKIYVDDNPKPVFFGTGSEDYFNYAWSSPELFWHAYCGQPRNDGPGTRGFVTNYRWHIIDDIPFQNQFAFYMELWTHEPVQDFTYARIAYYYGFQGMHDDNRKISQSDVRKPQLPDQWVPRAVKGAANSVFYQAEEICSGDNKINMISDGIWACGQLMEWSPKHTGEKIELNLPVTDTGNYAIYITARLAKGSGAFRAKINETDFSKDRDIVDLTVDHGILSRTFGSNQIKLDKGVNKLTLESVNTNPIGVDFIWIKKITH